MKIKLSRDEARFFNDHFFPYLLQWCNSKARNSAYTVQQHDDLLLAIAVRSIFRGIVKKFRVKLAGDGLKFLFQLSEHDAVILMRLLMIFPIPADQVYMIMLRQRVINEVSAFIFDGTN